jgi:Na+/glutamate symporter
VVYGGVGVALLTGGVLAHDVAFLEGLDTPLTVIGGVVLIATHLVNLHLCRNCPVCREQQAAEGGIS